ncbi:MAG TPA: sensor histidine kinase [Burkholderiales bacterium]|nr:sensor histidine kinase [Burkholderiales bacterium]
MLQGWVIVVVSFAYLGVLFAVASFADRRADQGRSIIANPYIYSLSLAVYATAWTFYGSVGRAAASGIGFLPIYLGPTLMVALWWVVLRKIIRISKAYRITSLADFISSRYGKSALLGGLVTVIAVIGIVPYISLQLKAVSTSFTIVVQYPRIAMPATLGATPLFSDTALYVALLLAAFTIAFGTRHLDASERHEGMVAAIAVESMVKLVAFLSVGVFVTFVLYDGLADLFNRTAVEVQTSRLLAPPHLGTDGDSYASWVWLTILSMLALLLLPRQFQVAVVENVDEKYVGTAMWLFPLYMLAMNIFVLPIAVGGLLRFPGGHVDPDTFVLTLPMAEHWEGLALLVFVGGLSAATGMVIVETIALSTMVCNDLVMPVLLRWRALGVHEARDLSRLLLAVRRGAIVAILLLGYLYFRLAGEAYALVSIGLISFAAVAQFGPALLGGLFWKGGTRSGALAGMSAGFAIWIYTLLLPAIAKSGWIALSFIEQGPFGIALLRPLHFLGLDGLDQITHAMIWSMLFNIGAYVTVSLLGRQSVEEHRQASLFVDALDRNANSEWARLWRGTASVAALEELLGRFLGPARAHEAFDAYARQQGIPSKQKLKANAELVNFAETQLAGAIGAASARAMVASVVDEEPIGLDEVMSILDEASQVIAYSHRLEEKSRELEAATTELRAANERLKELDRLKDDFISTVTHELRTPLTSIRAFSEILRDNPQLEEAERTRFLTIVIKESERLTRLINQVLDLAKIESGKAEWHVVDVDLREVIEESVAATSQLYRDRGIALDVELPPAVPSIPADRDRLIQVMINLLSNASKFCSREAGRVRVTLRREETCLRVDVTDNGIGISRQDQEIIFEKFRQVGDTLTDKPQGTGLGLPICREIVGHCGGRLWVESELGCGATFSFALPLPQEQRQAVATPSLATP